MESWELSITLFFLNRFFEKTEISRPSKSCGVAPRGVPSPAPHRRPLGRLTAAPVPAGGTRLPRAGERGAGSGGRTPGVGAGGERAAPGRQPPTSQAQQRGEVRPGGRERRKLQRRRKENRKRRAPGSPARGAGSGRSGEGPDVPETPTWQRPGPERAGGSSPASPPLPLPCPGKGFGERKTGRSCARGRRPSSGRRTSPRRACRSRAVRGERARRRRAPGARPGAAGPGEGYTDSAPTAGVARSIPGGRGAGAARSRRRGSAPRPRRPAPGRSQGRGPAPPRPAAVRRGGRPCPARAPRDAGLPASGPAEFRLCY